MNELIPIGPIGETGIGVGAGIGIDVCGQAHCLNHADQQHQQER